MSVTTAVASALGASACAAVAAALQSRSAREQRHKVQRPTEGVLDFARSQLTRRLWWGALLVQATGLVLHALALSAGSLTLVQPLLASAVILALPVNHYLSRTAVTRRELLWAGLLAVGLSGFLLTSGAGRAVTVSSSAPGAAVAVSIGVVAIIGCVVGARYAEQGLAAALLGAAAGTAFAAEAALLQVVSTTALTQPSALLGSAATYGVLVAGFAGVLLTQLAYRAGPMAAALPAIVTINPLVSVAYGVLVQHEPFRQSGAALVGEILGLVALCVGAVMLTRVARPAASPRSPR
jgi:hypothetical protein